MKPATANVSRERASHGRRTLYELLPMLTLAILYRHALYGYVAYLNAYLFAYIRSDRFTKDENR
jgi:hypothetical protein